MAAQTSLDLSPAVYRRPRPSPNYPPVERRKLSRHLTCSKITWMSHPAETNEGRIPMDIGLLNGYAGMLNAYRQKRIQTVVYPYFCPFFIHKEEYQWEILTIGQSIQNLCGARSAPISHSNPPSMERMGLLGCLQGKYASTMKPTATLVTLSFGNKVPKVASSLSQTPLLRMEFAKCPFRFLTSLPLKAKAKQANQNWESISD